MSSSSDSSMLSGAIDAISLGDDDFFALDPTALSALQARLASLVVPPPLSRPPSATRTPLPELRAASAPATVDWPRRSKFPLVVAEVRSNRREWEVHGRQNRLLLVSNLDTGAVDVTAPVEKGRRMPQLPPSRSGDPPDAINAAVSSITVVSYDLLNWFTREQLRGRLAVTFLEFDLASNTRLVTATGEGAQPPAGAALTGGGRIVATAGPAATAVPAADEAGVAFSVPGTVSPGGPTPPTATAPARLTAHVRMPRARVTAVVPAREGWAPPFFLAATVMLVKLDESTPVLLNLAAPAFPNAGEIESAFTVDLEAALAGARQGDWLVYLVVGDTVTGPQPLRIAAR